MSPSLASPPTDRRHPAQHHPGARVRPPRAPSCGANARAHGAQGGPPARCAPHAAPAAASAPSALGPGLGAAGLGGPQCACAAGSFPRGPARPHPRLLPRSAAPSAPPPATLPPAPLQEEYLRLRKNLPLYWRAFIWERAHEGQAYNYTIAALKKRWQAMSAEHYGAEWVSLHPLRRPGSQAGARWPPALGMRSLYQYDRGLCVAGGRWPLNLRHVHAAARCRRPPRCRRTSRARLPRADPRGGGRGSERRRQGRAACHQPASESISLAVSRRHRHKTGATRPQCRRKSCGGFAPASTSTCQHPNDPPGAPDAPCNPTPIIDPGLASTY
jgi:hypothetical protein